MIWKYCTTDLLNIIKIGSNMKKIGRKIIFTEIGHTDFNTTTQLSPKLIFYTILKVDSTILTQQSMVEVTYIDYVLGL
jgi:hypothetical protein